MLQNFDFEASESRSRILNQARFLLQDAQEMVVEQIWDTIAADSTSEELAYFARLKFAVPVATSCICALPLQHMLDWLLNPCGPPLVEGDKLNVQGHVPRRAFTCNKVEIGVYPFSFSTSLL